MMSYQTPNTWEDGVSGFKASPRKKATGSRGCESTRSIHVGGVLRDQRLVEGTELSTGSARPLPTNKRSKMKMKGVRLVGNNSEP